MLARAARIARSVTREGDVMVRYGGEEFLLILPAAWKDDVAQVGERLRRTVEEASIVDGEQTIRVTISARGTAFPETDAEDESSLVKQADKALYTAKETGRNRVVVG